jgi:hypothetical protein
MARKKKDGALDRALKRYTLARDADKHNRAASLDDLKFVNGEQWPEAVKNERGDRPTLTINRMNQFVRQVINDIRQNRPSIKVRASDGGKPETARVINGLIRNIEDQSGADMAYDTAAESAVRGGIGAFRILTEYADDDAFEQDICIKPIRNPFTVTPDPHAQSPDYSDMMYCFVEEDMPKDEFKERFPKAESQWSGSDDAEHADWFTEDTVKVAEYWEVTFVPRTLCLLKDGKVVALPDDVKYEDFQAQMTALGNPCERQRKVNARKVTQYLLTAAEELEVKEWAGAFIPVFIVVGEEYFIESRRHRRSLIRDAKDPQRMYNYNRSQITELIGLSPKSPFLGPEAAFKGLEDLWATANTKSHAYLPYKGAIAPARQGYGEMPAGLAQEAAACVEDLFATTGINPANLGMRGEANESGRKVQALQREGDVSTFHFSDNLTRAIRHAGRCLVDLVPRIYDTARTVRILQPDGSEQFVPINYEHFDEQSGRMLIHDLAAGKYDVAVTVGPSYTTQRLESSERMLEMAKIYPPILEVAGDLLIKNLDLPEGDEIVRRIQGKMQQGQQDPNAKAIELQQQIESMKAQTGAELKRMDIQAKKEIAQYQAQIDAMLEQFNALVERQTKLEIENIRAGVSMRNEEVRASRPEMPRPIA